MNIDDREPIRNSASTVKIGLTFNELVQSMPIVRPRRTGCFISVMIPTFNRLEHLQETLLSVLNQLSEEYKMEVFVVDNHSLIDDPEPLVLKLGCGRVNFIRNETNLGLAGNFNRCIELASGEWIHILHSDDFVYEGFYDEVANIAKNKQEIEAIVFRCHQILEGGEVLCETPNLGGLETSYQARYHFIRPMPVQCPGVVVRRSAYERLGGWSADFRYLLDVEIWSRIFFNYETYFSSKVLAAFRLHNGSESTAQKQQGGEFWELYKLLPYVKASMRLTHSEIDIFHEWLERRANDHCRTIARTGNTREWWRMQCHYFGNIKTPISFVNYVLRFERNFRYHLWAKIFGRGRRKK